MLVTTAEDSYNIFKPNLDADDEEVSNKEMKGATYQADSEEEQMEEERRMVRAAKKIS